MSQVFKPPVHVTASLDLLTRHKFKDEIVKNLKVTTTEY